jgi:hypothetical protein
LGSKSVGEGRGWFRKKDGGVRGKWREDSRLEEDEVVVGDGRQGEAVEVEEVKWQESERGRGR